MYEPDRKMRRHALVGRLLGTAARRLEGMSRAHVGASLDRETRAYAFPLLTDERGLSFPVTDRQSLNHFVVHGPKSSARSRLLLDIADAKVRRGSGLIHVSAHGGAWDAEIEERTHRWSGFGRVATAIYDPGIFSSHIDDTVMSMLEKVFDERWIVFVRLPDPAKQPMEAELAEARLCEDLSRICARLGKESILGHWRHQYNGGNRIFRHAPTPIVHDDASRYAVRLNGMQASMSKALGFSIVHCVDSEAAAGTQYQLNTNDVRTHAMTNVVMGERIELIHARIPMPRLGPDFFRTTAEVRGRQTGVRTPSWAIAG